MYKCFNFLSVYALLSEDDVQSAKKCYILDSVRLVCLSNVRFAIILSSMFLVVFEISKMNYVYSLNRF